MVKRERSRLDAKINALIRDQLVDAIASFHNKVEIIDFLDSFLTKAERAALMKRLAIAALINRGESYATISKMLNVSPVTIGFVKNTVLSGNDSLERLIARIDKFLPDGDKKKK